MSNPRPTRKKAAIPIKEQGEPAVSVLLRAHLWSGPGDRESQPPQVAIAMVEDLLSASRCTLQEANASSVDSVFANLPEAVNAARRIGLLFRAFCSASESGFLDGCVTLSNAAGPTPSLDLPLLLQTRILEPTLPGQVLVIGPLCEVAKQVPGLRFSEVSAGVVRPPGVHTVLHLMPPIGMEEIQNKPIVFRPARPRPQPLRSPAELPTVIATSVKPAVNYNPKTSPSEPPVMAPSLPARPSDPSLLSRAGVATRQFPSIPPRTLGRSFSAVATACILAVAIFVGYGRFFRTTHIAPGAPQPVKAPSSSAVSSDRGHETHQNPIFEEQAPPKPKEVSKPSLDKHTRRPSDVVAMPNGNDPADDPPNRKTVGKGVLGFSAEDVRRLIGNADTESGNGDYDKAIQDYKIALKYDPKNISAKQGLDRAIRNKGK